MTRLLALTLTVGLAMLATAAAPPPRVALVVEADQLDYLFLASDRPVLLRIHLRLNDRPYDAAWNDFMDRMFRWFDKNKDGVLQPAEAARIPDPNFLTSTFQGSVGSGGGSNIPFATIDSNKDGRVSKEEFRAYYRNQGLGACRFNSQNYEAQQAQQLNEAITARIDTNKDGKLTEAEVGQLMQAIRSLDENEDELWSSTEINIQKNVANPYFAVPVAISGIQPVRQLESGWIPYDAGKPSPALGGQILGHYDRNKNGKLERSEVAFTREEFDSLDSNRDQVLDVSELAKYLTCAPEITFRARTGQAARPAGLLSTLGFNTGMAAARVDLLGKASKLARKVDGENLALALGDSQTSVQVNQGQPMQIEGARQFYIQQWDALAGKKGHVDRSQERENQQYPYLFQIFNQADENSDGKMTKKELTDWFEVLRAGSTCMVTLQVSDQGRSLFGILDVNGDGQLSLREIRDAWKHMKPRAKNPSQGLAIADLPRTLRVAIGQGNAFNGPVPPQVFASPTMVSSVAIRNPGQTPLWFRKMDRNRDGDVSPKEWLGTEETFRELDTDGDGLISGEEANRYEARKKKAK